MTTTQRKTTADGFEYETEPTSGILIGSGESFEGVRVKYRRVSSRRWERFTIVHPVDDYEVYLGIQEHSKGANRG